MAVKLWTLDGTCHQGLLVKLGLHVIPNESLTSKHTLNVKNKTRLHAFHHCVVADR